ncbi:MAG: type IV pilus assembly protein PilB, partial [Pseudomonadales bacterium]
MTTNTSLNGIARQLVNQNLVDESTAIEASELAKKNGGEFISTLIDTGNVNAAAIAQYVASDFGLSCFDLDSLALENIPKDYLNEELLVTQNAVPIAKRGSKLFLAISDPTNSEPLDKYKFSSGLSVEAVIVEDDKLAELRVKVQNQNDILSDGLDDTFDLDEDEPDTSNLAKDDVSGIDETPVVRYVNKILLDAIKRGASDVHVEPYEKIFRIRYRIDGILEEVAHPPLSMAGRLTARLKVMSRMDISERRVPQDGRIKLKVSKNKAIDFRVNTCPTLFGEKTVLRILDPSSAQLGIDALGYEPEQKKLYMDALANPYGMILVTGPTGSGKTVSLYTGLNILNEPGTNISTVEDPAEINLAGINQV